MKRLLPITIALVVLVTGLIVILMQYIPRQQNGITVIIPTPTASPIPARPEISTITVKQNRYAYDFFAVEDPSAVTLVPNFTRPKDSETLMRDYECLSAINGGFYDKESKPLGFLQSGEKILGRKLDSDLVNGFLWASASGSAVISSDLPHLSFRFAVQTGPVLLFNGRTLLLSINNDAPARRMVAAKSMNDRLLFITAYDSDSVFEGPLLADLPEVIDAISNQERLDIADAINMDGGSASAFYHGATALSELTPVGSLFCTRK